MKLCCILPYSAEIYFGQSLHLSVKFSTGMLTKIFKIKSSVLFKTPMELVFEDSNQASKRIPLIMELISSQCITYMG